MKETSRRNFVASAAALSGGLFVKLAGGERTAMAAQTATAPNRALLDDLVVANRILVEKGFLETQGHVSVRSDRDPNRYYMSWRRAPELIVVDDILEHDLDNNVANAKGHALYQERFLHGEIYKVRPDVRAIVHGHTPSIVAFSSSNIPLRPVIAGANFVGQGVPAFQNGASGGGINNAATGARLAQALGKNGAVLMRGHGVVVVGPSLPALVLRAVSLDTNAQIQSRILSMGDKPIYLEPAENTGRGTAAPAAAGRGAAAPDAGSDNAREWEAWTRRVQKLLKEQG